MPLRPALFLPSLLLLLALFWQSALCYKVLVFSETLTRSHVILNARVAEALARDGHNVTILEVEFLEPIAEFSGSSAEGVRKIAVKGDFIGLKGDDIFRMLSEKFEEPSLWTVLTEFRARLFDFHWSLNYGCEKFLDQNARLLEKLRAEKFDMFIGEQLNFCGSALSHLMGIPVHVLLVSCPVQEHVAALLGLPFQSSYVPGIYEMQYGDRMNIGQRLVNLVQTSLSGFEFLYGMDHLTGIFRHKFGEDFPSVRDIVKNSPLVLVNVDEFVEFPRPLFPNVVYIGGLEQDSPSAALAQRSLAEPFSSQMAKGVRGVVFFSLGSAVRTVHLPPDFLRNLLTAFGQLGDWHFIVKVSPGDSLSQKMTKNLSNVFLTNWAPQSQILAHPRTRLFISHGGYNSLMESALGGTPIISMGFFADQRRNAMLAQRNGWGLSFNRQLLLEGPRQFRETMLRVLREDSFARNASRLRGLLASKPFSAREKLVKSVRFLEQNGGQFPELLAESRNLGTLALYNVDLALMGLGAVTLAAMGLLCLAAFCLMRLGDGGHKTKRD